MRADAPTAIEVLGVHAFSPALAELIAERSSAKREPGSVEPLAEHVRAAHPDQHRCTVAGGLGATLAFEPGTGGHDGCGDVPKNAVVERCFARTALDAEHADIHLPHDAVRALNAHSAIAATAEPGWATVVVR